MLSVWLHILALDHVIHLLPGLFLLDHCQLLLVNNTQLLLVLLLLMAVATSQTKIKLFDGSTSNPTVSAALKWARKHVEKAKIVGFGTLTATLQKSIDDMTMDLAPHITAESALSDDRAYVREDGEVFASLTPDQIKKYADGETTSALTMVQNVLKSIADTKMSIYITHATAFSNVSTTIDSHAVLGRFKNFTATLSEVRFHKLFELKDAIKKIVAVIAPNVFLVNEVIAMWSVSTKGQAALTALMTYVMDGVDVPGAYVEFPSRKKDKGGKGDRDRNRTPNNNGSRWKPCRLGHLVL